MPWRRIRGILDSSRRIDSDVEQELSFHIEEKVAGLVTEGRSEAEAHREVMESFGDYRAVEAACREYSRQRVERQGWKMMSDTWGHDIRLAFRTIRRNPGFSAVVAITLALGIGATTAVFSIVNGVLLEPLPYADADELTFIWQNDRATGTLRESASTSDFYDFRERSRSFRAMAMYSQTSVNLTRSDGEPQRLTAAVVTHDLGVILGVGPQIGRSISPEEDVPNGPNVVLLSDRLWRTSFEADPGVVGRTVSLDGVPTAIIGVLQPGLDFPSKATDIWMPIQQSPATAARNPHWVTVVGRLEPGISAARAHTEMVQIAQDLEAEFPANVNRGAFVEPVSDFLRGDVRMTLWVLFGAVLTVLLIACVNVANLLLARGAARARETAIYAALGAGYGRLLRRFLVESLMITGVASIGGVALAVVGTEALLALAPAQVLALGEVRVDRVVLGFTLLVSVVIGVSFGLLPALQASRLDLQAQLKEGRVSGERGTGSKMPLRRLLVAAEIAMSVVLLVSAGLLMTTLRNLQSVDPGFRAANLLRMDYNLPVSRYPRDFAVWPDWPEVNQFHHELVRRVEAIPGVESATITTNHPLQSGFTNSFSINSQPADRNQGEMTTRIVTPGYFETVGLELVSGRLMDRTDDTQTPLVVVINRAAAERYFGGGDALGSTLSFWGPIPREVIGIVGNERIHGLHAEAPPTMYANMYQAPPAPGSITLMVETASDPTGLSASVRETIWSLDADLAVFNVSTMEQTLRDATARERFIGVVSTVFSGVALFLALLGIHGVLSYAVAQRRHEVGIRMALGATRRDVLGLIVSQGMAMTIVGLVIGLVAAVAVTRLFGSLLFGVEPFDVRAYGAVALLLGTVALLATALPARKASRIDPMTPLRGE